MGKRRTRQRDQAAVGPSLGGMRLGRPALLVGGLVLLAIILAATQPPALNAAPTVSPMALTATVRCEPDPLNVPVGATTSVTIYVQDVVDLFGLDVRMRFDPAYVQVVDADPATPGVQIQPLSGFLSPDFVVRRIADNETGLIRYALTQVAPSPPASGSGAVARIDLYGVQPGTLTIPFPQVELVRRDGSAIPAATEACTWQFNQPRLRYLPLIIIR